MTDLVLARVPATSQAEAHWSGSLPLGLGYLAAVARGQGFQVRVVDGRMAGHRSLDETLNAILSLDPAVVGLSCLTVEFPRAIALANRLKSSRPSLVVIMGGAHINALPDRSMKEAAGVDYMIAGEAESSLASLLTDIGSKNAPGKIPGLHSRDEGGAIHQHGPPEYGCDISTLPFPAWDLFPRTDVFPILSERGCPYSCVFCSRNMSRIVRSRPVEHVIEEVRWLDTDFHATSIYFEDETFGLRADRACELLEGLIQVNRDRRISFKAQTRIDRITSRMARMMKQAGFGYVEIGVESGDQSVLDGCQKGLRVGEIEGAIRILENEGIKTWLNFIIGLPGESRESVRKSIELAVRLNPDRLSVAIIVAYPGCDIYDWASAGSHGYHLLSRDWENFDKYLSPSVELEDLPYPLMRRLQVRMYVEMYLRNMRLGDLARLLWKNRAFLQPVFRSTFSSSLSA